MRTTRFSEKTPTFSLKTRLSCMEQGRRTKPVMHNLARFCVAIFLIVTGYTPSTVCHAQLIAETRDGSCHLTVEGQGQVFTVHVLGLKPGELLNLTSVSEGESLTNTANARPDGSYGMTLFPAVEGKASGKVTLSVKSSRCQLKVTFPWRN